MDNTFEERSLILVSWEHNTYVKEGVFQDGVVKHRNRWVYRYGKLFFRCQLWVELENYSIRYEEYLKKCNGIPKEKPPKIPRIKPLLPYRKMIASI